MKKEEDQISSRHRYWLMLQCLFWMYQLFVLIVALYIFSQFIVAHTEANSIYQTTDYNYSLQAIENWEKGYIVDIKLVNTNNCPQGFSPLINYTWPGTIEGCYCDVQIQNYNVQYILEGSCNSDLIHNGCKKIGSLSEQQLKMWKGGKLLCYKRASSLNFYNSTLEKTEDNIVMKACASEKNYEVNTLPDLDCPVSDISNASFGTTQSSLTLDTLNSLHIVSQSNYPIADFKLTQYQFCPFFNQINISPNKEGNYILQIDNYSTTCTGSDPRINEIDYLTEQQFLTNNTRIYDLISALPGYPRPSTSYYYKLGFIPYAAWTQSCRSSDTHSLHAATTHLLFTQNTTRLSVSLYIAIPCLLVVAFLFRIFFCVRRIFQNKSKKEFNMLLMTDREVAEQLPNLNIVKSFCKQFLIFMLEILLIVAFTFAVIYSLLGFSDESLWLKEAFTRGCTDNHLEGIFRNYEVIVDSNFYLFLLLLVVCIVLIIINISYFVIRVKYGDLKQKQEEFVQEVESAQELNKMSDDDKKDFHLHDSSEVILFKEKQEQIKVYDLDNAMGNELGGAEETKFNFYGSINLDQQNQELPKRKKKKKGIKKKNLFKDDDPI